MRCRTEPSRETKRSSCIHLSESSVQPRHASTTLARVDLELLRMEVPEGADDDPPADLLNEKRIRDKGIDAKYLEAEKGKQVFDVDAVGAVIRLLDGPSGFAYAARLN